MIRTLSMSVSDYHEYVNLIQQLSLVDNISKKDFEDFVVRQNYLHKTFVYVIDEKIVGCTTVLIERKLSRNAMHIEDVVTDSLYRGQGISTKLLLHAKKYAEDLNCYKIILDCSDSNVAFYERVGFTKNGNEMKIKL